MLEPAGVVVDLPSDALRLRCMPLGMDGVGNDDDETDSAAVPSPVLLAYIEVTLAGAVCHGVPMPSLVIGDTVLGARLHVESDKPDGDALAAYVRLTAACAASSVIPARSPDARPRPRSVASSRTATSVLATVGAHVVALQAVCAGKRLGLVDAGLSLMGTLGDSPDADADATVVSVVEHGERRSAVWLDGFAIRRHVWRRNEGQKGVPERGPRKGLRREQKTAGLPLVVLEKQVKRTTNGSVERSSVATPIASHFWVLSLYCTFVLADLCFFLLITCILPETAHFFRSPRGLYYAPRALLAKDTESSAFLCRHVRCRYVYTSATDSDTEKRREKQNGEMENKRKREKERETGRIREKQRER